MTAAFKGYARVLGTAPKLDGASFIAERYARITGHTVYVGEQRGVRGYVIWVGPYFEERPQPYARQIDLRDMVRGGMDRRFDSPTTRAPSTRSR